MAATTTDDAFANALARRYQREHNQALGKAYRKLLRTLISDTQLTETDAKVWLKQQGIAEPQTNGTK